MDAIEAAFHSAAGRMPWVSLGAFRDALAGAEVAPVVVDGETAGAVIVKGNEIHACVMPWACGLWMNKRFIRLLDSVIAKHGIAKTSATTEAGRQFVQRLGFVQEGYDWVKYGH